MRLIDCEALRKAMYHEAFETDTDMQRWDSGCWIRYKMFENALESAPTIDAVPVVHGEWIWDDEGYHCSDCFFHAYGNTLECLDGTYRYCPNCGAKMDGRKDDE